MSRRNPIVVVTGANGGVGFGICHRLLIQLCQPCPSDAKPAPAFGNKDVDDGIEPCESLTLIMACRSVKRGEAARAQLFWLLDEHLAKLQKSPEDIAYAKRFRQNVRIDLHYLDLASVSTIFRLGAELRQKYSYISHVICNAGLASFIGIDWALAIRRVLTNLVDAVTNPDYNLQSWGERSVDGLGWVWQCNVFGHYCLFRELEPALQKSPERPRVLWMSSLEGRPGYYEAEDWQLLKTRHSYQASKYQMDLIATILDRRVLNDSNAPRHLIVHPAVTHTNVSHALASGITDFLKVISFYLARFLGSPNHPIHPYKAAISAVHVSLVALAFLPTVLSFSTARVKGKTTPAGPTPIKIGSETDWWGRERVGVAPVLEWDEHEKEAGELVKKCEVLYTSLREAEGKLSFEQATEHM
ncbi:NAD(P)-binding protein [Pleurotus eryngii]|uniref:NAD(P)-binding protein n=1 Tax=Pleurotus eryngii TaxID=5323 RepID=A0A9P6A9H3_PLEER|nr:NAD(P)-binding protein [Pleurotus eryngii]